MDVHDALNLLKEKGYRYTGKREKMVRIFFDENRFMSAKDVSSQLQKEYQNLSFDTIYRNLSLFEKLGILESTEFQGEGIIVLPAHPKQNITILLFVQSVEKR